MKRKIYQQLIDWKLVSNGKSALLNISYLPLYMAGLF